MFVGTKRGLQISAGHHLKRQEYHGSILKKSDHKTCEKNFITILYFFQFFLHCLQSHFLYDNLHLNYMLMRASPFAVH